jgi:murein DD-endopeptidase MepM/ murein hydrolase activator NlpD
MPFRAAQPGVVVYAGLLGGYGNTIILEHANGDRTLYGHASGIMVRPGERVEVEQIIGTVGSTGRSTAPHLHFELQRNGQKIDPTDQIRVGRVNHPLPADTEKGEF